MFDTKTNLLACVDAKSWPFKNWRYAQNAKIWNAHYSPPREPRAKNFWISKFLPRGYLHTKNDQNRWVGGALEWALNNFKAFLSSFSSHFYTVEATNFWLVSIERYLVVSIPYIIHCITRLFVGQSLYIFIRLGAMTQNRHSYPIKISFLLGSCPCFSL